MVLQSLSGSFPWGFPGFRIHLSTCRDCPAKVPTGDTERIGEGSALWRKGACCAVCWNRHGLRYETIGAFRDGLAAGNGRSGLRGPGYGWTEGTVGHMIGPNPGVIDSADRGAEPPDTGRVNCAARPRTSGRSAVRSAGKAWKGRKGRRTCRIRPSPSHAFHEERRRKAVRRFKAPGGHPGSPPGNGPAGERAALSLCGAVQGGRKKTVTSSGASTGKASGEQTRPRLRKRFRRSRCAKHPSPRGGRRGSSCPPARACMRIVWAAASGMKAARHLGTKRPGPQGEKQAQSRGCILPGIFCMSQKGVWTGARGNVQWTTEVAP